MNDAPRLGKGMESLRKCKEAFVFVVVAIIVELYIFWASFPPAEWVKYLFRDDLGGAGRRSRFFIVVSLACIGIATLYGCIHGVLYIKRIGTNADVENQTPP